MEKFNGIGIVDYIFILFYLSLLVFAGYYFSRKIKNMDQFFSAGKKLSWWVSGLSVFMGTYSAYMFVGLASVAYTHGFPVVVFYIFNGIGGAIGMLLVAHLWRRARLTSPTEFLRKRYKENVRQFFTWIGIPYYLFDDAIKIYAVGKIVALALGVPVIPCILVCGAVMISYSMLGGLIAIAVTDVVQFIILALAVFIILPFTFQEVGGWSGFVAHAPAGFMSLTDEKFNWHWMIMAMLLSVVFWGGTWHNIQRFGAVKDERAATKTAIFAAVGSFVAIFLFVIPPMLARNIFTGIDPEYAFIKLFLKFLPTGLIGLVVCALLAATISSVGTHFNLISGIVAYDLYKQKINPQATGKQLLRSGRIGTIVFGILAVLLSISVGATGGAFEWMMTVFGLVAVPLTIPFLIGILYKKSPWWSPILTMVLGIIVSAIAKFGFDASWPVYTTVNIGTCLLTMLLPGFIKPNSISDQKDVDKLFENLAKPVCQDIEENKELDSGPSNGRFIGITLLILGLAFILVYAFTWRVSRSYLSLIVSGVLVTGGTLFILFDKKENKYLQDN